MNGEDQAMMTASVRQPSLKPNVFLLSLLLNLLSSATILEKPTHELTLGDLGGRPIDVVFAEPFFLTSLMPWEK